MQSKLTYCVFNDFERTTVYCIPNPKPPTNFLHIYPFQISIIYCSIIDVLYKPVCSISLVQNEWYYYLWGTFGPQTVRFTKTTHTNTLVNVSLVLVLLYHLVDCSGTAHSTHVCCIISLFYHNKPGYIFFCCHIQSHSVFLPHVTQNAKDNV